MTYNRSYHISSSKEKGTKFYDLFNKGELKTVSDHAFDKQFYFSNEKYFKREQI